MAGIEIKLTEPHRVLNVLLGDKFLGRVQVHQGGHCAALTVDPNQSGGFRWLEAFPTVTQAANRILREHGFGNMTGGAPEITKVARVPR